MNLIDCLHYKGAFIEAIVPEEPDSNIPEVLFGRIIDINEEYLILETQTGSIKIYEHELFGLRVVRGY